MKDEAALLTSALFSFRLHPSAFILSLVSTKKLLDVRIFRFT